MSADDTENRDAVELANAAKFGDVKALQNKLEDMLKKGKAPQFRIKRVLAKRMLIDIDDTGRIRDFESPLRSAEHGSMLGVGHSGGGGGGGQCTLCEKAGRAKCPYPATHDDFRKCQALLLRNRADPAIFESCGIATALSAYSTTPSTTLVASDIFPTRDHHRPRSPDFFYTAFNAGLLILGHGPDLGSTVFDIALLGARHLLCFQLCDFNVSQRDAHANSCEASSSDASPESVTCQHSCD